MPKVINPPVLPHDPQAVLPGGRVLLSGETIVIPGEGKFVFRHRHIPDGSLTCWGPVNTDPNGKRSVRSFRPEQVRVSRGRP